jgi:hypothetical protein
MSVYRSESELPLDIFVDHMIQELKRVQVRKD